MPDFMLCNSKLTFQLTMTPEKTNYITQGADGVKRLKQGPDLSSYRGLSVIHTRSFAMETGQHPRDLLRRRVRTAEYYRIVPSKDNARCEFEFYNEERDTFFSLTFKDLLRYALYDSSPLPGESEDDNHAKILKAYGALSGEMKKDSQAQGFSMVSNVIRQRMQTLASENSPFPALGARIIGPTTQQINFAYAIRDLLMNDISMPFANYPESSPFSTDLGIKHLIPRDINGLSGILDQISQIVRARDFFKGTYFENCYKYAVFPNPRLNLHMRQGLFNDLRRVPLFNALRIPNQSNVVQELLTPGTPEWNVHYLFYLEIYQRGGVAMDCFQPRTAGLPMDCSTPGFVFDAAFVNNIYDIMRQMRLKDVIPAPNEVNIANQFLPGTFVKGSVNHPYYLFTPQRVALDLPTTELRLGETGLLANPIKSAISASFVILTYELLVFMCQRVSSNGLVKRRIEFLNDMFDGSTTTFPTDNAAFRDAVDNYNAQIYNYTLFPYSTLCFFTQHIHEDLLNLMKSLIPQDAYPVVDEPDNQGVNILLKNGIQPMTMDFTTQSHLLHPSMANANNAFYGSFIRSIRKSHGYPSLQTMKRFKEPNPAHRWTEPLLPCNMLDYTLTPLNFRPLILAFYMRINATVQDFSDIFSALREAGPVRPPPYTAEENMIFSTVLMTNPRDYIPTLVTGNYNALFPDGFCSAIAASPIPASIDLNEIFRIQPAPPGGGQGAAGGNGQDLSANIEVVVVRPNIEHNMLGIIMGLAGSALGNTLWGQTELSVYDDSMHGIWGMSYKYHERAIVFNERNLIRLWDIAYDGYNGGKDDTYVNWRDPESVRRFKTETLDVSKSYRGQSMMVMAFYHDKMGVDDDGGSVFERHFRRNWPSPIVFHDNYDGTRRGAERLNLPVDSENLRVVDVEEFRVFNNPLYSAYRQYKSKMPPFNEMHAMRKSAGQSSYEAETPCDSLAFQGSMRVKKDGVVVHDIQGSGHHGPDYIGVASVRAGKGQKVANQAPTLHRLI